MHNGYLRSVSTEPKRILFGVLNWGLGHATRSIPIVEELEQRGFEVVLASDGQALQFLQESLPGRTFISLPTYGVRYGKKGMSLWGMSRQLPKIWRAARAEKSLLSKLVDEFQPAAVISDNRLGFWSANAPSVFITHQLQFEIPVIGRMLAWGHYWWYRKFQVVWIPDFAGAASLAGRLAKPIFDHPQYRYIGPKSRFTNLSEKVKTIDLLVVLSGPEPQRTTFEQIVLSQAINFKGQLVLVRGTKSPLSGESSNPPHMAIFDFVHQEALNDLIAQSRLVLSRAGYSSIMDFFAMGIGAVLVPTPGQPEQEYLAQFHGGKNGFHCVLQHQLDISQLPRQLPFAAPPVEKILPLPLEGLFAGE
jgi:UDP-N-acetylglucosamine:LPS N-acetylglucosamine transferase